VTEVSKDAVTPARARIDDIRRRLASTADAGGRARLRLRLADALAVSGDGVAAVTELRRAAAEGPATAGLALAAWVLARATPDRSKAVALAREARAGYEKDHDTDKVAEVDKWLRE